MQEFKLLKQVKIDLYLNKQARHAELMLLEVIQPKELQPLGKTQEEDGTLALLEEEGGIIEGEEEEGEVEEIPWHNHSL